MNSGSVTIALSVHNVSGYVQTSLDSILAQTFRDFELLCIDDASTDGTWEILTENAKKDERIRLVRQEENQGLSVSRNRAIDEACGEYLLMLDGDDLFAPNMVEKAYNKAKETDADLVMWDYCTFYHDEELPKLLKRPSSLIGFNPQDKVTLLRRPGFTWVKLIRTNKLRELGVRFPEGLTKQDIPVWWQLVTSLDKIAILPERLSFYRQNPHNTTNRKDRSVFSLVYVMDITGKYLKENGLYETYKNEYLRSRLNLLQGMYDFVKPELKVEAMQLIRERLDDDAKAYIYSKECECGSRTCMFLKGYFWNEPFEKAKYDAVIFARSIYRLIKR